MVLPTGNTNLRMALDHWFAAQRFHPMIVGECEDSALLRVFGQEGVGIFPVPTILETEIQQDLGVKVLGRVRAIRQQFYAITTERQLKHPATVAIVKGARQVLSQ
jgi:LysR family transcriptional activator of nhaA